MPHRWGVMGTGAIALALTNAIRAEGGEVVAVSSASTDRARRFAEDHGVRRWYGAHHDLLDDPEVEVVYVATTNDRHRDDALACVRAGVPVLVEKPFTLDVAGAEEVVAAAREAESFLMEAMWMRFQPAFLELERRIDDGQVGTPVAVQADLGFPANDRTGRLFSRARGGGALLDIGVYPLTFAISILGEPDDVQAVGELTDGGVDRQVAASMRHADGVSSWVASFRADTGMEATVSGHDGSLRLHSQFHHAPTLSVRRQGEAVETVTIPEAELGYQHEVREVARCLDAGLVESPRMPWSFTLTVMRSLDAIRERIGVTWDGA